MSPSDDIDARMATIEARLDRIDAAFNKLVSSDYLLQQEADHKKHEDILKKLEREQKSLRMQTGSYTADQYEDSAESRQFWDAIGWLFLIVTLLALWAGLDKMHRLGWHNWQPPAKTSQGDMPSSPPAPSLR
jgi:hypothetical protein